jgi:hypothetical protein
MDYMKEAIDRITAKRETMRFNSVLDWANQLKADRYPTQGELCEIHEDKAKGVYALKINGLNYLCEFFRVLDRTGSRCKVRNIDRIADYSLAVLMEY